MGEALGTTLERMKIKIFADGADLASIMALYKLPHIKGFTTNPTLMRKAGIADYEVFARDILARIPDRPISLEVFADDLDEMEAQARTIASWGANIYIKVPVTNTKGVSCAPLIRRLSDDGAALNVTALTTLGQVEKVAASLSPAVPSIVSVFAGRVADTGVDPIPMMRAALQVLQSNPKAELLWASPRELLNLVQADEIGCHIITVTPDILSKLSLLDKNLDEYSLETVRMFYNDAVAAGYSIQINKHG